MDDDLTASHWDDVLPTSHANLGASNIGSIFDSLSLDDPHRDGDQAHLEDEQNGGKDSENDENDEDDSGDDRENAIPALAHNAANPYESSHSPFASTYNQSEMDQITALKKQERDSHKSSLLMELTSGAEEPENAQNAVSPIKLSVSESLFEDKGSPITVPPLSSSTSAMGKPSLNSSTLSPTKASQLKSGQFRAPRARKVPAKTVIKHFNEGQSGDLDPLSSSVLAPQSPAEPSPATDKTQKLVQEVNMPLYNLTQAQEHNGQENSAKHVEISAKSTQSDSFHESSNDLEISLGDPVKVGDITTAHIVYEIKTQNKNPKSTFFPETSDPIFVSRRYKDFRWIYHQLQNNHPGKIIPPPPSKQTYIGRFNENFIENRRMSLEKMLQKISRIRVLADDGDFVLFLTSQNFANDAKEREQASGSGASIQASNGDDESDKSSTSIITGTGAGGFMSSLFSMTVKYPEPDDFFLKKKGYIEDLEHNLKTFYKSLELIASQRVEISAVTGEIANIVEELADLEISRTTSDLLAGFAEVHSKLRDNLDRVNLQDQLTLGFTIEEYLRIIGSVKYTFETRSKIYQLYQSFKQDLMKKEESLDRLNSRYKSSVDKINQVSFEVDKLKQKVSHYENSFKSISDTIKAELDNFDMEKIHDFRNSVEIFIESSIESQKEAIELWETFYERQKLTSV